MNRSKNLNCKSSKRLYQISTNNGRTGYNLTSAAPNGSLRTVYNVTKGRTTIRPGMAKIGSGQQGVVFLASTDKEGKRKVIIKVSPTYKEYSPFNQPSIIESKIQTDLYRVVPRHIPKIRDFVTCAKFVPASAFKDRDTKIFDYSKQYVMYTEYAHGGTLKDWLRKMGGRVTDKAMADIIRQVIATLKKIHDKYPEFRHNDLHLGNLLVDDTGAKPRILITDFGLSRLSARGSNPTINNGGYRNYGMSNRTPVKYDMHYFLNALDNEIKNGLPETKAFLDRMLPPDYRGHETGKVKYFRLRNGADNSGLPSFTAALRDPFLSGRSSPRIKASSVSPSVGSMFRSPTPRLKTVMSNRSGGSAADIASNALSGLPGVSVSTLSRMPSANELLRMSPTTRMKYRPKNPLNFAKLSPRRRAAFMTKTRGENSRSIVRKNFTLTRGAAVARTTVARVAANRKYLNVKKSKNNATARKPTRPTEKVNNESSPARKAKVRNLVEQAIKRVVERPPTPRANSGRGAGPSRRRSSTPAPMPAMTNKEKTKIARTFATVKRAVGRAPKPKAKGPSKPKPMYMPPKPKPTVAASTNNARALAILNAYANQMTNQRTLTRGMLKNALTRARYSNESANRHARAWEARWTASRQSVNNAIRNFRAGKNLRKLGYPNALASVARRRHTEKLFKGPNGRVRSNKSLLSSKKKEQLVTMAQRHGIAGASKMTKDALINALYG